MRFHNSGRVHADCTPTGDIAKECDSMDLYATNCVETVVGKDVTNFKIILFGSPLIYCCHFASYLLIEKNVKDRGRKSLNIIEE
jgi:hypothetical protein